MDKTVGLAICTVLMKFFKRYTPCIFEFASASVPLKSFISISCHLSPSSAAFEVFILFMTFADSSDRAWRGRGQVL